jgi:hypothetical protein
MEAQLCGPSPRGIRRSRALVRIAGFLLAVLVLGAACTSVASPPPAPTEEAGRAFLDKLFERAISGELGTLCESFGSGTCPHDLRSVDPGSAPSRPPAVVGTRILLPTRASGDAFAVGGRIFDVCGSDGLGRPYFSQILVFQSGPQLLAVNAVFWSGARIGSGGTAGWTAVGTIAPRPSSCT